MNNDVAQADRSRPDGDAFRVLIAGGGIAALEALLALRALAGDRVAPTLLAPDPIFRHRPLSVTEPFGLGTPRHLDLLEIALQHDAGFLHDGLAEVAPEERTVLTEGGQRIAYDALLIAIGARGKEALPGALAFRDSADEGVFADLLAGLAADQDTHLVFAVPAGAAWPLGLYELALLTRAHARQRGLDDLKLTVVTPEARPMEIFGRRASDAVAAMLGEVGVELRVNTKPVRFADHRLELGSGEPIACERVISLPSPHVASIPGLPQEPRDGFIPIGRFCEVLGVDRVFAAGDATWFPVKQGGLAAQMADSAASAIAALARAPVEPQPFRPVLRGALLTESGPRYLRAALGEGSLGTAARSTLWWPPAKVAGKYLAPYLAGRAGYRGEKLLTDLQPPPGDDPAAIDPGREDVLAVALSFAEDSARSRDFPRALRWLEVAEDLELYLPREYELKRTSWQSLAQGA